MPGMLQKPPAFAPRYYKFESISLQRRVIQTDHPDGARLSAMLFLGSEETLLNLYLVAEPAEGSVPRTVALFTSQNKARAFQVCGWSRFTFALTAAEMGRSAARIPRQNLLNFCSEPARSSRICWLG
jgi:hypothetical protein